MCVTLRNCALGISLRKCFRNFCNLRTLCILISAFRTSHQNKKRESRCKDIEQGNLLSIELEESNVRSLHLIHEGVSKSFQAGSVTKYMLTTINTP
jgi:hypothetical protein